MVFAKIPGNFSIGASLKEEDLDPTGGFDRQKRNLSQGSMGSRVVDWVTLRGTVSWYLQLVTVGASIELYLKN